MRFQSKGAAGKLCLATLAATLLAAVSSAPASAQTLPTVPCAPEVRHEPDTYATIRLTNMTEQKEANDLQTDLRNILPRTRVYHMAAQSAISLSGTAADLELARKIIADLDQPRKVYRLTFSLVEMENGKRTAAPARSYLLVTPSGERTSVKLGNRVPLV